METLQPIAAFVIPSYNEGKVIRKNCLELLQKIPPHYIVVVVDDGSHDNTSQELNKVPVHYLQHPINMGQGAALQTGISYALKLKVDAIVTFDADGQHSIEDALAMINVCLKGDLDVVLGSRFLVKEHSNAVPAKKQLVLKLATFFTRLTTGLQLTDTHNGLRVFKANAAAKIHITHNGMSHASQILNQIAQLKLKYAEYPTTITYSEYSMAKGQKISNSINILWDLLAERFRD